jgi:geranylgeranyl pyrophosphate synthase
VSGSSDPSFDLEAFLRRERLNVEAALQRALERVELRVREELVPPIRQGVLTGGKRLRPILCVEAHRACGGSGDSHAYDLGVSVELIHAYSLMHDDLPCMDDAELRRGQPTVHRIHGEELTMEAGAALIPLAALQAWESCLALGCDADIAARVVKVLAEAAGSGGMVGGQVLDLEGEGRSLSAEELDTLHGLKTGALLTAPLVMGGIAAGASPDALEALESYGRSVGLAFQIADDILDATSSSEDLGKNPSDSDLDKSTYVRIHGVDAARQRARGLVVQAVDALSRGGINSDSLVALAEYTVDRDR